ncbi:MAG: hypothetical protein KBD78_16980 [Oligoflexales bacterium]|nr:hypothetical protein [Oligoflexales bacterium]
MKKKLTMADVEEILSKDQFIDDHSNVVELIPMTKERLFILSVCECGCFYNKASDKMAIFYKESRQHLCLACQIKQGKN